MKRNRHDRRILDESIRWIRDHPAALNHDVPRRLRDEWTITREEEHPSALQLSVFLFGYCQAKSSVAGGNKVEVAASEVAEKFNLWQMKLGLAELHEKTDLQSAALPLFDFPAHEQISFWSDASRLCTG